MNQQHSCDCRSAASYFEQRRLILHPHIIQYVLVYFFVIKQYYRFWVFFHLKTTNFFFSKGFVRNNCWEIIIASSIGKILFRGWAGIRICLIHYFIVVVSFHLVSFEGVVTKGIYNAWQQLYTHVCILQVAIVGILIVK